MKPISSAIAIGMLLVLLLGGCGLNSERILKKRAEEYYRAVMYNDYDTLYNYLCASMKAQIRREEYVRFMEDVDTRADFDEFEIDSVVIRGEVGKVRLKFKGGYWIFRERKNVTSTWLKENGQWYVEKDARGRFWDRFLGWIGEERMRQLPQISEPLNRVARIIERYYYQNDAFPTRLDQLGAKDSIVDPNSDNQPFRYRSDGATYWILAANGPDGKPDLDVQLFHGDMTDYPPPELIYDPLTGKGDLFRYGPIDSWGF